MNWLTTADAIVGSANNLATAVSQLKTAATLLTRWVPATSPPRDYENLRLAIVLDIRDHQGQHAVLERSQVVRFLVPDTGVVRDLIWGNANQVARYTTDGVSRLGLRSEGSKQVMLLLVPHRPRQGERLLLKSRRDIRGALQESSEYCEMLVERPTRSLGMTVLFPRTRPPTAAQVVSSQDAAVQRVPVRYGADGRPFLQWRCNAPKQDRTYSLRLSW